jgi:hypothetical protein
VLVIVLHFLPNTDRRGDAVMHGELGGLPMSMRNGLLGLMALVVEAGLALAAPAPPTYPQQVEGRETNPIAREFYQAEKSVERLGSGPEFPTRSKGEWVETLNGWGAMLADAWQLLPNRASQGVPDRAGKK